MKGFFEWFKSGSKMKRWMFLILIGTIAICYAIAKILVTDKLSSVLDVAIIVGCFVIGFLFMIIGFVYMQKRTLELLVKETDKREEDNLKSLIFNRKVYSQGPKIVVIGGGTGLNSVLKGLKKYTDNLTAIVTVSDYGEKLTDSRKMLETLPLEDIKDSLIALSTNENEMSNLLNYKFKSGKLQSLTFGDIYLLAMQHVSKDFSQSVKESSEVLNITGKVLPVSMDEMKICAELEDGTVIENRADIPEIVNKKESRINRIFVSPTNCRVAPGVVETILEADAIIIGPGNLYTNVLPNLLVKGVAKAIKESKGFKIYISNIMTDPGQTAEYTLSDHIKAIVDHVGEGVVDYCIYDTGEIVPEIIRKYNEEGAELVEQDTSKARSLGVHLLKRDLATVDGEFIRHNPDAIASSIVELICEDLKFKDMQNNPEYVYLNDRLKHRKVRGRKKAYKTDESSEEDANVEKKSRFSNKYQERIQSIKESESKGKNKSNKNGEFSIRSSRRVVIKDENNVKNNNQVKSAKKVEKSNEKVKKDKNKKKDKKEKQKETVVSQRTTQLLNFQKILSNAEKEKNDKVNDIAKKQKQEEAEKRKFFEAINKKD